MLRFLMVLAIVAMAATTLPLRAGAGPVLLFEPGTGNVVYADDADKPWYPASLTKLMTGYLTFIALKEGKVTWDTKLVTSEKAHAQPPSKIGLPVGGELPLDQGVRALIIKSANDVAMMLAETVAGSEEAFAELRTVDAGSGRVRRRDVASPEGTAILPSGYEPLFDTSTDQPCWVVTASDGTWRCRTSSRGWCSNEAVATAKPDAASCARMVTSCLDSGLDRGRTQVTAKSSRSLSAAAERAG